MSETCCNMSKPITITEHICRILGNKKQYSVCSHAEQLDSKCLNKPHIHTILMPALDKSRYIPYFNKMARFGHFLHYVKCAYRVVNFVYAAEKNKQAKQLHLSWLRGNQCTYYTGYSLAVQCPTSQQHFM